MKRRVTAATWLMNLTMYPAIIVMTLALALTSWVWLLAVKIILRWRTDRIVRLFIYIYGRLWMLLVSPFVRFRVQVDEAAVAAGPAILVANHASFFDIYCTAALPFWNVAFVVRAWPFKMFWYAPFMRLAGYVNSEELDGAAFIAACRSILSQGGNVLVYPEGHRSKDGKLQRFHSGAFKLALETGAPVIPLCIAGTDQFLPPGTFVMQPARVALRALAPVNPGDFDGPAAHGRMRRRVKELMALNLQEMTAQA